MTTRDSRAEEDDTPDLAAARAEFAEARGQIVALSTSLNAVEEKVDALINDSRTTGMRTLDLAKNVDRTQEDVIRLRMLLLSVARTVGVDHRLIDATEADEDEPTLVRIDRLKKRAAARPRRPQSKGKTVAKVAGLALGAVVALTSAVGGLSSGIKEFANALREVRQPTIAAPAPH